MIFGAEITNDMAVTLSEKGHLRLLYISISIMYYLGLSSLNVSVGMALPSTGLFLKGTNICWWFRNLAPVEVGSLSNHLQGFIHPKGGWLGFLKHHQIFPIAYHETPSTLVKL